MPVWQNHRWQAHSTTDMEEAIVSRGGAIPMRKQSEAAFDGATLALPELSAAAAEFVQQHLDDVVEAARTSGEAFT
jgi:hypothetical protein